MPDLAVEHVKSKGMKGRIIRAQALTIKEHGGEDWQGGKDMVVQYGLQHCPHATGGIVQDDQLTFNEKCCWCGERRDAEYRRVSGVGEDHGRRVNETVFEQGYPWVGDECPERKAKDGEAGSS